MDKWGKKEKIYVACVVCIGVFFLIINSVTPLMGEDYALSAFSPSERICGVLDLLQKMFGRIQEQMTGWNVRVGEQISIVFSCFDKTIFNILNSIMAIYFLWLVNAYAYKDKVERKKYRVIGLVIPFCALILWQPVLGEIFFWRTGSTNYLWSLCILLTFALPLRYYLGYKSIDCIGKSKCKIIFLTVLGFLAGFTNENSVVVVFVVYLVAIVYDRIIKRKTPIWIYITFITFTAGFVFMMKAPSTAHRMAFYKQMFNIGDLTLRDYIGRAENIICRFFTDNKLYVIVTLLCILISCFFEIREKQGNKKERLIHHSETLIMLFLTAIACGALIMSPYIETRAFLLTDFMMLVCMVYYFSCIIKKINAGTVIMHGCTILIIIPTLFCMTKIYITYNEYNEFTMLRQCAIELSDDDKVYWGEYYGNCYTRILTTREDYLMDNEKYLERFFRKDIDVVSDYVWDICIKNYMPMETIGSMDYVSYEASTNTVSVGGWCAFEGMDSKENDIYVYIESEEQRYYFKPNRMERTDVVKALSNKKYLHTGYNMECVINAELIDVESMSLGICIVNRESEIYADIDHMILSSD